MMVLRTLRTRSLHVYAIAQHIQQTSDELLQIEEGTLYPALQRLLREGWVQAEWAFRAPTESAGRLARRGGTSTHR
jgi:PadR family transcriptional regulator, regulatory protein PadR